MFEVLLTEKVKKQSIQNLLEAIEVVQSFDFDWGFYLVDAAKLEAGAPADRITPFPANCGALLFTQFAYDEEKLLAYFEKEIPDKINEIKKLVEVGYPLADYLGEEAFENFLWDHRDCIILARFEAILPVASSIEASELEKLYREKCAGSFIDDVEVIETEYYYLDSSLVRRILDECEYLHEFIERLSEVFDKEKKEDKGLILMLRGEYEADKSLTDLERDLSNIIDFSHVLERALIFNRIL